jgi:predicted Na+-dependent transporter
VSAASALLIVTLLKSCDCRNTDPDENTAAYIQLPNPTAPRVMPLVIHAARLHRYGMAVRRARPDLAQRLERPASIFSLVFLALIIAAAVAREKDLAHQFAVAGPAAISLNILTMILGFAAGWLAGLPRPQRITISIESGIQNGTLALAITLGLLDNPHIAMPSVVYSLFMFLTGALMIALFGRGRVHDSTSRG